MADTSIPADTTEVEVIEERPARSPSVDFDTRLGPTCMVVMMVVGIGFLIATMLIWGAQNLGTIFR
jgi:hypothetical protein